MITENQRDNLADKSREALARVSDSLNIVNGILEEAKFKKANKYAELATRATLELYQDQLEISKIALSLILRDISDDRLGKTDRKLSTVG